MGLEASSASLMRKVTHANAEKAMAKTMGIVIPSEIKIAAAVSTVKIAMK